jgi:2',3'-cyclic-nucleotide 2'-phosphodiesterase (5'-nucleotidase family)
MNIIAVIVLSISSISISSSSSSNSMSIIMVNIIAIVSIIITPSSSLHSYQIMPQSTTRQVSRAGAAVELDATVASVRTRESTMANLAADVMLHSYGGDMALLCGGTIRGDLMIPPGPITVGDIMEIFPFEDPCIVIEICGKDLREAVENGLSTYPKQEGRFPHVSHGVHVVWDPDQPAMSRISSFSINDHPVEDGRLYRVVTRAYMQKGHDGFDSLTRVSSSVC